MGYRKQTSQLWWLVQLERSIEASNLPITKGHANSSIVSLPMFDGLLKVHQLRTLQWVVPLFNDLFRGLKWQRSFGLWKMMININRQQSVRFLEISPISEGHSGCLMIHTYSEHQFRNILDVQVCPMPSTIGCLIRFQCWYTGRFDCTPGQTCC